MSFDIQLKRGISRFFTPTRIFIFSFLGIILIGTLFLLFPFSARKTPLSFINALFTSTSAVCVTGLTAIDIGNDLSAAGQIITLVLFQVGGLGIITFSVMLFSLMGRGISFKEQEIIQSTFLHTPRRDFLRLIRWILLITFGTELLGAVLLFLRFSADYPVGKALYLAVYHSVSAFNNCGYSLFSSNLIAYRDDWLVNLVVMGLIMIGGMGFVVHYELIQCWRGLKKALSLHSKIVLRTTFFLIVGGALLFFLLEIGNLNRRASFSTSLLTSLFQSVTSRTCGFNTVDLALLTNPTLLLLMILMFIGASPGSTGGGIKTTSFSLMILMIWNKIKGQEEVNVFHRTIPKEALTRTVAIILASVLVIFLIFTVMLVASGELAYSPKSSRHFFVEYLFEAVSAFGTVGLSLGVTPELNTVQKTAIIILMFIGRVGPITLAYAWYSQKKGITYAEESIMVG